MTSVVNVTSTTIANADATPRIPNNSYIAASQNVEAVETCECGVTDTAGSTYRLVRVPSGARVSVVKLANDAMSGTTSVEVGVYKRAADGGAAVSANIFATALDIHLASSGFVDVTYQATATNISKVNLRLWELLGLSVDPFLEYDIVVTTVTQSGAAGTLSMKVEYTL